MPSDDKMGGGGRLAMLVVGAALLAAAMLVMTGCATSEEWAAWRQNPTHFASGAHMSFSAKNQEAARPLVTKSDAGASASERWWGAGVPEAPVANVAGRWIGTWKGYGILNIPRTSTAAAQFEQDGPWARAQLILDDTGASESVPWSLRSAGATGTSVVVFVSGSGVLLEDETGHVLGRLTVIGDQMVGRIGESADLTLTRAR